jgi:hypothetical protein
MRSGWFFKRLVILALGAMLLCAPFRQTHVGSQNLYHNESDRSRVALAHSFQAHATVSDRGVLLEWRTAFELDILGFNIYRVQNGQRTQLNPGLIAGSALISRQQAAPGSYAWFDPGGTVDSEYYVESLDVRGRYTAHDAVKPAWSSSLPNRPQSELLANLGASDRAARRQEEFPDPGQTKLFESYAEGVGGESISDQWSLVANQPALKIGVRADGWYRITQPDLAAAGFATSADARNLRLFVGGNEIALRASRDSGALTPADYVEFWGQGLDLATTDTQIYWLVNGAQAGKRIAIAGEVNTNAAPPRPATTPRPIAGQDPPLFWFGGVSGDPTVREGAGTEGRRQKAVGSELGGDPTVREGAGTEGSRQKAVGRKKKAVSSEQWAVSSRDLSVPPASAGGSDTQAGRKQKAVSSKQKKVGSEQLAVSSNSRLSTPNSKPKTRNSKLRRRRHSRSLRRNHPTPAIAAAPNFIYHVQRKDRFIYFTAALNGDQENFFGPIVSADTPSQNPPAPTALTLALNHVEQTSAATAQVTVALQGVSLSNHQVNVLVNDLLAGTINLSIQDAATQTFSFPVAWLIEGTNTVKLVAGGAGHDTTLVDYVSISYPHSFRPDNDSLQFSVKSTLAARIDGFTSANIRVLDISDPANVQMVHPVVETSGAGFALTIQPAGRTKGRRLIALPNTQLSHPVSLVLNTPSTLNATTNGADLVIISHKDFIPALAPLVAQRQSQGFVVAVADVEDVFDEFSYGVHTPQAIRDFLLRATTTWVTKPRYVLLVGDASYDARNYFGFGNFDLVPSKEIDTGFRGDATALETASDDWLTDFDNDGIADISTGRLPVRTLAEANLAVSKIVNYSPANPPPSALLVADTQGSYYFNFEQADDDVAALLPASLNKQKVYRRLAASDDAANQDIVSKFNAGLSLVVYSGHGNVDIWGGSIFSSNDIVVNGNTRLGAMALTNGNKLPFVVVMDCLNGYFADPRLQGLAEALLKAPNGGAVASFASSGLTYPDGQHEMGEKMLRLLYDGAPIAIGDAGRQAKAFTTDQDVRRTWILFGDPTMKIR